MIIFWVKQIPYYDYVLVSESIYGYVDDTREPLAQSGWSQKFGIFVPIDDYSSNEARYTVAGGSFYLKFNGNSVDYYSYSAVYMYNSDSYVYGYMAIG